MSLARLKKEGKNFNKLSDPIKIATKYPEISRDFFASKGLNVNCIKMNGAIESGVRASQEIIKTRN